VQTYDFAVTFGSIAFVLHVTGYLWYATEIFRGNTRPNAASWLMWLFGAWVEYITFDAIDHHWSTSALPLACLFGVGFIFMVTMVMQVLAMLTQRGDVVYEKSEKKDYLLVAADAGAYALFLGTGAAAVANWIAVGTTIFTFYPTWKTTYRKPENEQPWPWFIWCAAYMFMFFAVIAEGSPEMLSQSFYPVFYFCLHLPVALLCFGWFREKVKVALTVLKTA
jgi:hypothetical protein